MTEPGISLASTSLSSDVLPSGQNSVGSIGSRTPICGVRPIPGNVMFVGSPSPSPSKPGWPSSHMSAAETAWAPAPSSECERRWYWLMAWSGAPMYSCR